MFQTYLISHNRTNVEHACCEGQQEAVVISTRTRHFKIGAPCLEVGYMIGGFRSLRPTKAVVSKIAEGTRV